MFIGGKKKRVSKKVNRRPASRTVAKRSVGKTRKVRKSTRKPRKSVRKSVSKAKKSTRKPRKSAGKSTKKSQKGGARKHKKRRSHKHGDAGRHTHKHTHSKDARRRHKHGHTAKQRRTLRRRTKRSGKPKKYSTGAVSIKKRKKGTGLSSKARSYPYRHQHPIVTNRHCNQLTPAQCGVLGTVGEQCTFSKPAKKDTKNLRKGQVRCVKKSRGQLRKLEHTHGPEWGRMVAKKSKHSRSSSQSRSASSAPKESVENMTVPKMRFLLKQKGKSDEGDRKELENRLRPLL